MKAQDRPLSATDTAKPQKLHTTIVPAHPEFWLLVWPPERDEGFASEDEMNNAGPDRFAIVAWSIRPPSEDAPAYDKYIQVDPVTIRGVEERLDGDEAVLAPDGTVMDCAHNTRTYATMSEWIEWQRTKDDSPKGGS